MGANRIDVACEFGTSWRLEEHIEGHVYRKRLGYSRDDLGCNQRVTAKFEEVLFTSNLQREGF